MTSRMSGCVDHTQSPAGLSRTLQQFVLRKKPVHLDESLKIARRDGVRDDIYAQLPLQMIRPADVIGVQMREPNLSDISLFENPIESGLLFFVTRRGINNNHFVAANHIT